MAKKREITHSREKLIEIFGELDVRRAEVRGVEHYIAKIASPKAHYLAFAAMLLQYHKRTGKDTQESVRTWLGSLPEFLRGSLIWWHKQTHFVEKVLRRQRHKGHWPYGKKHSIESFFSPRP